MTDQISLSDFQQEIFSLYPPLVHYHLVGKIHQNGWFFLNQGGYEVGGIGHLCESHDFSLDGFQLIFFTPPHVWYDDNDGDDDEGDGGLQLSSEPSWDMMQPQIKAC